MSECTHPEILEVTTLFSPEHQGICPGCPAEFVKDRRGGPWVRVDLSAP